MPDPEDHRLFLLGAVVDAFASIELRAQLLLSEFVRDEWIGEVMVADLPFSTLAQKLMVLSTHPGLGPDGEMLQDWTKRARAVAERRNRLVHSLWWTENTEKPESWARVRMSARGKPIEIKRRDPGHS
jgi:hypothetical protein